MTSTSTSSWPHSIFRSFLVSLLVLVMLFSIYVFFRNEHSHLITGLLLALLASGSYQYWQNYDGSLLTMISSFMLAYCLTFIIFSTPISVYLALMIFISLVGLTYYLLLAPPITLDEVGALLFITASSFIIALYLPTNLFNVALLTTLPVMLATPILVKKTLPLTSLALHVTLTGLIGAGLICITAVLFI